MALALAGCSGITGADCTRELGVALSPRGEQQIAVGQSFTATVSLSSCGGWELVRDVFTWSARDALIARVEPSAGRVTGRLPGSTFVDASGARYGHVGTVPVVVR
jgi:hypothetical protein